MTDASRRNGWIAFGTAVVAFIAVAMAMKSLAAYAADPSDLWQSLAHDRNGHFNYGLEIALALRDLRIDRFLDQLNRSTVWPPVHGLVLGVTMLVGGIDLKLAIVPSLIGWIATVMLVWLISVRLFTDPRVGIAAGAIAVAFTVLSPAFRLVTADAMLEGLGAALSCLCLYCYIRAREAPEQLRWWRFLAIALTVLFFEKFNYWLLTLAPLTVAFMLDEPALTRSILARLRDNIGALRDEWRHPLNIAAAAALAVTAAIWAHGPLSVHLFGGEIKLHPPGGILTLAYALVFIRVVLAWREHRAAFEATVGPALRQVVYWHVLPVTASLLVPKRLSPFLWYVGPTHFQGSRYAPWLSALNQWDGFTAAYHAAPWAAVAAAIGIVLALFMLRRAQGGLRAVALLGLIGAAAVVLHPQQQLRFQTTVLPPLWILAGAGWAMLIGLLAARPKRLAGHVLAAAAVAGLIIPQIGYAPNAAAYAAAIRLRGGPSDYDTFKAYWPYIANSPRVAILSTGGGQAFYQWTIAEACKCKRPVELLRNPGLTREEMRVQTAAWLQRINADTLVAIAETQPSPMPGIVHKDGVLGQFDALNAQTRFVKTETLNVPRVGEVTIWRRRS